MFPSELFQVVIFVFLLSLASEIVLYLWCYSAPSFRTINASITKQSRKLDNLNSTTFSAAHKSKKAERLEKGMKQEATKELAVLKVKQTTVSVVGAVGMFMLLNRLYAGQVVAKLPFEAAFPVSKVAHRGLDSPLATDCAVTFIYVLCQTGIRMNLQHFLAWGPSRAMQALSAFQPPKFGQEE